jgi:hypothetical protein
MFGRAETADEGVALPVGKEIALPSLAVMPSPIFSPE